MISVCSLLLGTCPLDGLGVIRESPRLWWTSESLYCPVLRGDLIVKTKLDLDDRSERIRVERDPTLCELLNGDVGIICGWPNFRNKSCMFVPTHFDLLIVLARVCSYLEFGLTLGLVPRVWVASFISLSFIVFKMQTVCLSVPRFIVLAPDLLFYNTFSYLIGHIRPPSKSYLT
jgi:hypothetical protein